MENFIHDGVKIGIAGGSRSNFNNIRNQNNNNYAPRLDLRAPNSQLEMRLLDLIGWPMKQKNGERVYGPSPQWKGAPPPRGSEVFIGKVPRDCFEEELMPVLLAVGPLYMFRLMMDFSGHNRGFAFAIFATPGDANAAVLALNGYMIRPNNRLGAAISVDNRKLYLNGLKAGTVANELAEILEKNGVQDVLSIKAYQKFNKAYALIEFESHMAASQARRVLVPGCTAFFGINATIDWADPKISNADFGNKVKSLCMKNISSTTTAYDVLQAIMSKIYPIEVQYFTMKESGATIEFYNREHAEIAMRKLTGLSIHNSIVEVFWEKHENNDHSQIPFNRNCLKNITNTGVHHHNLY